jgi:DNA-binding MarR family transcriptional regulator
MTTPNRMIDLTPFGYTPTESLAYTALLTNGPSSGYAAAGKMGVARANAYQALRGLVAKGGAEVTGSDPKVFRATRPADLLARIARDQAAKLDTLEREISAWDSAGASATTVFSNEREFYAIALRVATRAPGPVACLAPASVHSLLLPIWRKRALDGSETNIWIVGRKPPQFPVTVSGEIEESSVRRYFGGPAAVLLTAESAAVALFQDEQPTGQLTSEPAVVGAVRAALATLISST